MTEALAAWWAEWSTYRPSDFLMFSPRIYWRLFESLNTAAWPAQLLLIGLPAWWLAGLGRRWPRVGEAAALRVAVGSLAAGWAVVAWCFLAERYAPINWPAHAFAVAFGVQALAGVPLAVAGRLRVSPCSRRRRVGAALLAWALLGHPGLAPLAGRPWGQAEVVGLAPDPTVIATLGLLLLIDAPTTAMRRWQRALWLVPLAWCGVSAATLATMGSPQAAVMLAAGVLAVAAAWWGRAPADLPAHRAAPAPAAAPAGSTAPPR